MNIVVKSYDEFVAEYYENKYDGKCKCAIPGCGKPAYYEGGDARCWFPVCEEHARIEEHYVNYLRGVQKRIRTRRIWADEPALNDLAMEVAQKIAEIMEERMSDSILG